MLKVLKPKALQAGDTIAIVSPSSDIVRFPRRTERAIDFLRQKGYDVKMMPHADNSDGYNGGTPQERASDINNAFLDKSVDAILCSTGGLTANAVLPYLDYRAIIQNPKIFCGYSDITTLLLMITSYTKIVTFHGPTLLSSFGDFRGAVSPTFEQFQSVCGSTKPVGILPMSARYTTDNQYWDKEDDKGLQMQDASPPQSFGPNVKTKGWLFGGNLQTFVMLMHERKFIDLTDAILFLEEDGLSTDWYERYLTEIDRKGIFAQINGLIFAKPSGGFVEPNPKKRPLNVVLQEIADKYNLPILTNVDCGHTKPLLTFPLGVEAELDTVNNRITLLEAAVCC